MRSSFLVITLYIAFFVGALIGEIRCIYQFFTSDFEPSYKRELIYGFSAITGLGAVVGYINISDSKIDKWK